MGGGPDFWLPDTQKRLTKQLDKVRAAVADGRWYTLEQIAKATGAPPASASARLRDLRNKFGYLVERLNMGDGLYLYSVSDPAAFAPQANPLG